MAEIASPPVEAGDKGCPLNEQLLSFRMLESLHGVELWEPSPARGKRCFRESAAEGLLTPLDSVLRSEVFLLSWEKVPLCELCPGDVFERWGMAFVLDGDCGRRGRMVCATLLEPFDMQKYLDMGFSREEAEGTVAAFYKMPPGIHLNSFR